MSNGGAGDRTEGEAIEKTDYFSETVGGRDAALEPTWTYLRRVSEK